MPDDEHIVDELLKNGELLCSRCDYLNRERQRLQNENQQLRARCDKAKQRLANLLARLSDYEDK